MLPGIPPCGTRCGKGKGKGKTTTRKKGDIDKVLGASGGREEGKRATNHPIDCLRTVR